MNHPFRVLQVVTIMNLGGLESFLMTIYRNIDRTKVQFDFLVHRKERGAFDDEIEQLGGRIFRMDPIRPTKYFKYKNELKSFFTRHNEYSVIHSHINENSAIVLSVAKTSGISVRIAHSHAKATAGPYKFLRELLKRNISSYSTMNLACSTDAGKWLYGANEFHVFKNSIDVEKFKYPKNDSKIRKIKTSIGFNQDDFVIGLIARFSPTKNHEFLIEVFNAYLKLNKNSKLLLVGDGDLKNSLEKKIKQLNIENYVVFTGNVSNPEDYLGVMNLFLMTSFNEGMPVVLIEAQCNGLPILMSDTIPDEIELTDLTYRKSLNLSADNWATKITEIYRAHQNKLRHGYEQVIRDKHFDIKTNAQRLVDLYVSSL
jgi:glycosyltransferase involved in cell wall biosynthesis